MNNGINTSFTQPEKEAMTINPIIKIVIKILNIGWPLYIGGSMLLDNAFVSGSDFFSFIRQFNSVIISILVACFVNVLTLIYGCIKYGQGNEKLGEFLISIAVIPIVIFSILFLVL